MLRYSSQELEKRFRNSASIRISKKRSGDSRYAGDNGYWDGGRCNYGGAHNLQEDCQRLTNFFIEITELKNARKELINFNNQQEFESNKQGLVIKINNALNGLNARTGAGTSIGGVCIIWKDFVEVWKNKLDEFRKDLELLKQNIENIPYNDIKELKKLESEERKIKNEIEENERKARNESDPDKKKKFIFLADQAKDKWKKILSRKKELKSSRLGDSFNPDAHINDFLQAVENKLTGKNKPVRPTKQPTNNSSNSENFSSSNSQNNPSSSANSQPKKSFLQRYWRELVLFTGLLIGAYYIINQPDDYEKTI